MLTVISGGQTGVDRGALDAALAAGVACGGWCPEGRLSEDGLIPARYPLRELPRGGYPERTRANVRDSDATLVITFGVPAGGTQLTVQHARSLGRPLLIVDAEETLPDAAADEALAWIESAAVGRLNVAGPRASREPRAYAYSRALIGRLLERSCELRSAVPPGRANPLT